MVLGLVRRLHTKTQEITVHMADERPAPEQLNPRGWDWSSTQNAVGPAPASQPSAAAEPSAPASSADAGHVVPESVETGEASAWWLAGLAALPGGVLVRFRKAFGIA